MKWIEDRKVLGSLALLIIVFTISLITYGKNKENIFKDQYMENIFVEEESRDVVLENNINNDTDSNTSEIIVEIKGEVNKPDVYTLPEGSIIKDLIDKAGGLTDKADISNINRAKKLQNHELIVICNSEEIATSPNISVMGDESALININTATIDELKKITGVGDVKAQSIIDYREKNGGFKNIDEMKNIDGIGDKTFEKIKSQITL